MNGLLLRVDGDVKMPLALSFDDLAAFPRNTQVRDVSRLQPSRQGDGVTLASILDRTKPNDSAAFVTLYASGDGFAASVPLKAVRDVGVLVYCVEGKPLTAEAGGPIRFLIPGSLACRTGELDMCANVKFVDRIELSAEIGPDSRGTPHAVSRE